MSYEAVIWIVLGIYLLSAVLVAWWMLRRKIGKEKP